jgi:tRNA1(Val) A37 N6-methylase TrmN6
MTDDALLGGRVRLRQPATGYRAAIDPVLLAAAVPAVAGDSVLDVGAGAGAAALCLARRVEGCRVTGIELDPDLAGLCRENAALNGFDDRVAVTQGDLTRPPPSLAAGTFDHVMANPPYLEAARASLSPDPSKAAASVEGQGDLADWVGFCLAMARPRGSVTLIHRADRLDRILACLGSQAGAIAVLPLWPKLHGGRPAKRVIVQARKGTATPLRLLPGITLHADGGGFTPRADAILREGAALDL